jgi:TfoX/Sxy family transcriptional regulator of competence genes
MSLYREQLQEILAHVSPQTGKKYKLELKNCFGAVAGYVDENIFCSYGKFGFALKLAPIKIGMLLKQGAKPLQYFPNGHVKKDYVVLPEEMLRDTKQLRKLIATSTTFVTSQLDR